MTNENQSQSRVGGLFLKIVPLVVLAVLFPAFLQAGAVPQNVWKYTGHNNNIAGVAVDDTGNVYSGSWDNEVHKIDPSGDSLWTYTGHSDNIRSVAVDDTGNVYSAGDDREVHKIDPNGDSLWTYTAHNGEIQEIAVDDTGYIYSGTIGEGEVHKINPGGTNVWEDTGGSQNVRSVAVDDAGYVYRGQTNGKVYKLDPNGDSVWTYSGASSDVQGMVVDDTGNVYIGYSGFSGVEIHKVDSSGDSLWTYSDHLQSIFTIAMDDNGNLYVNGSANQVHEISASGNRIWAYAGHSAGVSAITVDDSGKVYSGDRDGEVHAIQTVSAPLDGEGTLEDPYEVSSTGELRLIEKDMGSYYEQTADIVFGETEPVGHDTGSLSSRFIGTYDGGGYKIHDGSINQPAAGNVGLFANNQGTIRNIKIEDVNCTGLASVGILAGNNSGTIVNAHVTGQVSAPDLPPLTPQEFGGLVGRSKLGHIEKSSASVNVDADSSFQVGGLVGFNSGYEGGVFTVKKSKATGTVSGCTFVGGLVGYNEADLITESYATGKVTATGDTAGGLVGRNVGGTVTRSYAAGTIVSNGNWAGGLVGDTATTWEIDYSSHSDSSYWDYRALGVNVSIGGDSLATDQMLGSAAAVNMSGLDFSKTWKTISNDYPRLRWEPTPDTPGFKVNNTVESSPDTSVVKVKSSEVTVDTSGTNSFTEIKVDTPVVTDTNPMQAAKQAVENDTVQSSRDFRMVIPLLQKGQDTVIIDLWTTQSPFTMFYGLRGDTASVNMEDLPGRIPHTDTGLKAFGRTAFLLEFADSESKVLGSDTVTTDVSDTFAYIVEYTLCEETAQLFDAAGFDISPGSNDLFFNIADTFAGLWRAETEKTVTVDTNARGGIDVQVAIMGKDLPGALGGVAATSGSEADIGEPCLIQKIGFPQARLKQLRGLRDYLLESAFGRKLTSWYYDLTGEK